MSSAVESPFTQYCDTIDKKVMIEGLSFDWYYSHLYKLDEQKPEYLKDLLIEDWIFRAKFGLNIVASFEGEQGTGKSLFALFVAYFLGILFNRPFDIDNNLYATPEDLDNALRSSDFRTTHFIDEQRKKNVGLGSISTDLSLQDYEEQCRYTQKNILYASPSVRNHEHYFVFSSQRLERISNNHYCSMCPPEIKSKCHENPLTTNCPQEFVILRGGSDVKFYERLGYPKLITFLLTTKRKIDKAEIPRGFVSFPMPTPETVLKYDLVKRANIQKLESQEEDSFKYIVETVENFILVHENELTKMVGSVSERTYKLKDPEGNPYLETKIYDNRKYSVVSANIIESLLYIHLKTRRKYTTKEIALIVSMIKGKMQDVVFTKNKEFFEEKNKEKK